MAPWRYVQFEYAVRLLNDGYFGQDINLPALTVTYNLKSAGADSAGRDQSYVLPALPMRILSLVPRAANDIRDASSLTFEEIESRRYYATAARVAASIALVFAAVFAVLAVLRFAQRFRVRTPASARPVPAASLLAGCASALRGVQKDARAEGWTPELARRALPAMRVAGASALGRPIAQRRVAGDVASREGQVMVRTGRLGFGRAVLSASTTPSAIASALDRPVTGRPRPHRADAARRRAAGVRQRRVRPSERRARGRRLARPRARGRDRRRRPPAGRRIVADARGGGCGALGVRSLASCR